MVEFPGTYPGSFEHDIKLPGQPVAPLLHQDDTQALQHPVLADHASHPPGRIDHHQMSQADGLHPPRRVGDVDIDGDCLQRCGHHVSNRDCSSIDMAGQQTRHVALGNDADRHAIAPDQHMIQPTRGHDFQRCGQTELRCDQFSGRFHHGTEALDGGEQVVANVAAEIRFAGHTTQAACIIDQHQVTNGAIGQHALCSCEIEILPGGQQRRTHHAAHCPTLVVTGTDQTQQFAFGNDADRPVIFDNDDRRHPFLDKGRNHLLQAEISRDSQHIVRGDVAQAEIGNRVHGVSTVFVGGCRLGLAYQVILIRSRSGL